MKNEPSEYDWGGSITSPDTIESLEPQSVQPYTNRRNAMLIIMVIQQLVALAVFWQMYTTKTFGGWGYILVGITIFVFFMTKGSIEISYKENKTELTEVKIKKAIWNYLVKDGPYPDLNKINTSDYENFLVRNQHMARHYISRIKPFAGELKINSSRFMRLMLEYKI